jgi:hypothetical protein
MARPIKPPKTTHTRRRKRERPAMMKKIAPWIALMGAASLTAACTTTDPYTGMPVRNNTGTGALSGAGIGAVLGYLTNTI